MATVRQSAKRIANRPLEVLDNFGDQMSFYLRAIAWTPRTVRRYTKEVLRLLAEVSFGSGSLAVIAFQLRFTDNPNPYVDSSLLVWSLVAQWMTARKWIENWILWIVINTISIPLYISRGLRVTALLYLGLWILAFLGYRSWRGSLAESAS